MRIVTSQRVMWYIMDWTRNTKGRLVGNMLTRTIRASTIELSDKFEEKVVQEKILNSTNTMGKIKS